MPNEITNRANIRPGDFGACGQDRFGKMTNRLGNNLERPFDTAASEYTNRLALDFGAEFGMQARSGC